MGVDAGAKVDGEGTFGNVVGVQGLLGSKRCSVAIRELDYHRGSKGQEGLGRVLVEDGLGLVEGPVRSDGGVEGGLSCVVELVSDEGLEVEVGQSSEAVEDSDGFVVDDLGHSLNLVAVHIRSSVGDTAVEESEWGCERLADGLRISAEGLDLVSSCIVDGDKLSHSFQDGPVGLGFGAEDRREMAPVVDEVDADGVTTMGGSGERVWVEEDPVADSCRGAGGAVRM